MMARILIACEESQAVCKEFRLLGHEAYSCDIQECSGGHPEWHIQGDAVVEAYSGKYDLMIAHPPCTFMSKAGARWMYKTAGNLDSKRLEKALKAKEFFGKLLTAPIKHIAIENPVPLKIVGLPTHTQEIQPYYFGDPFSKKTLLWLKNLPKLIHSEYVDLFNDKTHSDNYVCYLPSNTGGAKRGQKATKGYSKNSKQHSKTFQGIAKAMATQWSEYINQKNA
jgi:hypothetical protein